MRHPIFLPRSVLLSFRKNKGATANVEEALSGTGDRELESAQQQEGKGMRNCLILRTSVQVLLPHGEQAQ